MTPLIVHVVFRLDYGGLENGVVNLVNGLSAEGGSRHAIIALSEATAFAGRLRHDVAVYSLGKRTGKDFGAYVRLFRLLRRLRPQIVHTRNIGTIDCALIAFAAGVPIRIHGEHGWDVLDPDGENRKFRLLRRIFAPFVLRFVTVSQQLRDWVTSTVGLRPAKVVHICNGVDTDRFRPREPSDPRPLPAAVFANATVIIGSVTRFSAIKDPLNLIEAFIRVRAECSGARLLMVGDGELRPFALRRLAEARAQTAAWLPGSRDDIPELLRCMDVFALGSLREGISNTILEAMASGLPVVATATGGTPELLADGRTGRLVPTADSVALARVLGEYAADADLRRRHGGAARADALTRFSIGTMVESYRRLYERELEPLHLRGTRSESSVDSVDPR